MRLYYDNKGTHVTANLIFYEHTNIELDFSISFVKRFKPY